MKFLGVVLWAALFLAMLVNVGSSCYLSHEREVLKATLAAPRELWTSGHKK